MTLSTSLFVQNQVPEHIRNAYPNFIRFLAAYYEFNDKIIKPFVDGKDADKISELLLPFLRNELAKGFSAPLIDERKFIQSIRKLISRKGTFDAVELLFRLFFDDVVTIDEPNKRLLRPSDGTWYQNKFFHIEVLGGIAHLNSILSFTVKNIFGNFNAEIEKIEQIDTNIYRIFVRNFHFFRLLPGNEVFLINSQNETSTIGIVIERPTKFVIGKRGKFWIPGQIIQIPGSTKDTLIRILKTDNNGSILTYDVFEHGYNHQLHSIIKETPFDSKPINPNYDLDTTAIIVNNSIVYTNTIKTTDNTTNILDRISGINSGIISQYFLENYESQIYASRTLNDEISRISSTDSRGELINPSIFPTLEDWFNSLTFFYIENQIITTDRGYYLNESGNLSNDQINIQDGFFFQLFSYVIESNIDISDYKNIIDNIHPGGLIYFSTLRKIIYGQAKNKIHLLQRSITLLPSEIISVNSSSVLNSTKPLTDSISSLSIHAANQVTKPLTHSVTINSNPLIIIDTGAYFIDYGQPDFSIINIIMSN